MMNVVVLPDDRLFQVSEPVMNMQGDMREIALQMIDTMHGSRGIGLAGVQVGIMNRLFVVHIDDDVPRVFINPVITALSDTMTSYEEGCLSIPGVYAHVDRPDALQIEAFDMDGKSFKLEASGLLARVIQHEYDHLEGRLFYQHLEERQQKRFLRAYDKVIQTPGY